MGRKHCISLKMKKHPSCEAAFSSFSSYYFLFSFFAAFSSLDLGSCANSTSSCPQPCGLTPGAIVFPLLLFFFAKKITSIYRIFKKININIISSINFSEDVVVIKSNLLYNEKGCFLGSEGKNET